MSARHPRSARVLAAVVTWLTMAAWLEVSEAQAASSPFDACQPATSQWSYDDLLCLHRAGLRYGRLPEARARLRQLGGGGDAHPWATLVLAHATLPDDETEAVRQYERAARSFAGTGEAEGEVIARQNLRIVYRRRGEVEAAAQQVSLAVAAAEASGAPLTLARASVLEAGHLMDGGGDVGRARRALLRAERLAFPGAPIGLRRSILFSLANANLYLGHLDEAVAALERHRALRQEDGSTIDAAAVAFNLLNARVTAQEARPSASGRARLVALAEQVVAETQALGRPYTEAQAHRLLGDLLRPTDPARAMTHLRRCLDLEAPLGYPGVRAACLWSLSLHQAIRDPARAEQLSREAVSLVSGLEGGPLLAYAWQARLRLVWQVQPEDLAIAESMEALRAIERLRAAQRDQGSRATLFGNWTRDYYWLTGRLLDASPARLEQAFEVGERLRARVLLDHLARAGVAGRVNPTDEGLRQDVTARLADVQRQLLAAPLARRQRDALSDQRALLELELAELGDGDVEPVGARPSTFASLTAVREALQPGEAMLWYSLAPWQDLYDEFGGGAWVLAVTRDEVQVHRLSTGVELDAQVSTLAGLVQRRDVRPAAWTPAAHRLGHTLLASALASLPASTARLVIVSDGPLHRLPFEALRHDGDPRTLGERFEVTLVPSATIWLHLRQAVPAPAGPTLVLADPDMPRGSPDGDLRLDPLPWARREARVIGRLVGPHRGIVHLGEAASEHRLKAAASGTGIAHLAAHARADSAFPDRSAVFLAPGSDREDGWLQPREIAALDLRGALVVLSACESAGGALIAGEGPLSLARAFFAGGAGAVIATRWALRDDDAAFMMERLYGALASGTSVGSALQRARRDAIAAGRPAAAWAGVALLGDGRAAPLEPGEPRERPQAVAFGLAVVAAALATGWLLVRVAAR